MAPSHAEIIRTLVQGRLPGTLQLGDEPAPRQVYHATDAAGRPLVLVADAAEPPLPQDPAPVVLSVDDVPPVAGAPSFGRALVSGHLHPLEPDVAGAAVHEFAEANPVADLLDVGQGRALFRIEVDRVRLQRRRALREIDLAGYAAAVPDPLHELEQELLVDLADHHAEQVASYFRFLLAVAGVPCCRQPPRAVRLDRYGFVVDLGDSGPDAPAGRWMRLDFSRPVHCRHELAQLLHPVLFHRRSCQRGH